MTSGWVAATVRARALARRRVGSRLARSIAEAPTLDAGLALLAGTAFEDVSRPGTSLRDAEHGIRAEQLWELRVLAGWLPARGIPLARSLAARFEQANVEQHRNQLTGREAEPAFRLGTLATSWPRLTATSSIEELHRELATSPWGDPGDMTATSLHDALTIGWLRMMGAASSGLPALSRWVVSGASLLVARIVAAGSPVAPTLVRAAMPLIGGQWASARSIRELTPALPATGRRALRDVDNPGEVWLAEARLRGDVESDGFRMLRTANPGPEPVLGALAVLAVDGWRVRAALASAAVGAGPSEVLDVVA